ncbi:squalene/phytoene synthase family protein [Pseudodonghicola flavimaris]|uniref:Squalene/phytoene synthase family protein n=1 Tax=Pseudodonghicola flavimaris TaxID=3050036 RepID=A0ABT7EVU1_9RHOB|nr:squalene/phytoene synthase family protein [Pseudodonghicola flavimaris]MDK3016457.1 squalene/phytoene synthase family protein [Pseudodonghicola flavimaris]
MADAVTDPRAAGADLNACADLVRRGDPDRFLAAMAAPVAARRVLFPLYAMNVEVSRAPWVTQEAIIAEMRLQWWRDALEEIAAGGAVRRHEVVTPLADVLPAPQAAALDDYVAVRQWDIYRDPFEDEAEFDRYIDRSAASLLWAAASALGAAEEPVLRDLGYAMGVANWLRAVPDLEARGRIPLIDGSHAGLKALAEKALDRLSDARARRGGASRAARPALLAGWQAGTILRQVQAEPARVGAGSLGQSEARKRLSLMARAASGRW